MTTPHVTETVRNGRAMRVNGNQTAPCDGAGLPADGFPYGNTVCPVCRGIANVDAGRIDPHTVKVIDA